MHPSKKGMGKGRTLAGFVLENICRGRKKHGKTSYYILKLINLTHIAYFL